MEVPMNVVSLLRKTETMGAREFRYNLDKMLRNPPRPCRIMLHNKPALVVLSDDDFLQIIEVMEELKNEGVLERVTKNLKMEHKKRPTWFWNKTWQKKEKRADTELKSGKVHHARSAKDLIKQLKS